MEPHTIYIEYFQIEKENQLNQAWTHAKCFVIISLG